MKKETYTLYFKPLIDDYIENNLKHKDWRIKAIDRHEGLIILERFEEEDDKHADE